MPSKNAPLVEMTELGCDIMAISLLPLPSLPLFVFFYVDFIGLFCSLLLQCLEIAFF